MKIEDIRTIWGPNIYNYKPVIVMKLRLEDLTEKESYELPGFVERLLQTIPEVHSHHCAMGRPGGFVERLYGGTYFGHIVEHVALELTERAGAPAYYGKTLYAGEPGYYEVVVEFRAEQATKYLLGIAVELVQALIDNQEYPLKDKIEEAKRIIVKTELGPSTRSIIDAADKRGIPWIRLNEGSLIQLGYGKYRKRIQATLTDETSCIAVDIASDKELTNRLLEEAFVPVPEGVVVRSKEEAVNEFEKMGAPVVVKPVNGNQGKGVSLNLTTSQEVEQAYLLASKYSSSVLIERFVHGKHYRVLVVGGQVAAASERQPVVVIGDGVHTIQQLVEIENRNPNRGEDHEKPLTKITIDPIVEATLVRQRKKLTDVPAALECVVLRDNANLSTGGKADDVTDRIHPQIRSLCIRAAGIIGLDVAGIDLVLSNISNPIDDQTTVIEVNAAPGIRMHHYPSSGQPRDVGETILNQLFPEGTPYRIPIFSITGTNGKTTTTRMISHIMAGTGKRIGMTSTDGIYIDGEKIANGDTTGPQSARALLGDPSIEVAVLETARGGIVRGGLAYDFADIAVVTNVQPDHIGQDGIEQMEDLVHIKSLVAERVREGGTVILNADDPHVAAIAGHRRMQKTRKQIVLFTLQSDNRLFLQHIAGGGTGYFVKEDWMIEAAGELTRPLMRIQEIPVTLGGLAHFHAANAMAAIAACRAYGLMPDAIVSRLRDFRSDRHNVGRCNLYKVKNGYVMVDYGHNPDAFRVICQMASRLPCPRVTGVVGVPGDRDNAIVEAAARVAAAGFSRIILREDYDLRGRKPGEIAQLMYDTIHDENPSCETQIVLNECEALETAVREILPGEVVIVFYEKLDPIMRLLNSWEAEPVTEIYSPAPVNRIGAAQPFAKV